MMNIEPNEQEPDDMPTIDLSEMRQVSDVDLFEVWDREKGSATPVEPLISAYELEAKRRGFDLQAVAASVVTVLTAGQFNPDMHPRGMDGTFIEKLGIVDVVNFKTKVNGKDETINKQRGQVTAITPDPKNPGKPDIKVVFKDPTTGENSEVLTVKPGNVKQAPQQKARLDGQPGPGAVGNNDRLRDRIADKIAQVAEYNRQRKNMKDGGLPSPGALGATVAAGRFNPDMHPRGMDGTFIEKLGIVDIVNFKTKSTIDGKDETINKQRGQVVAITPDPKKPGQPDIRVVFKDPKTGKPSESITVKPGNIKQAPQQKARLDGPDAEAIATREGEASSRGNAPGKPIDEPPGVGKTAPDASGQQQAKPAFLAPDDLDAVAPPAGLEKPSNITNDMVIVDGKPYTVVPFNGGERHQLQPFNHTGDSLWLDEQQANNVKKVDWESGGEGGGQMPTVPKTPTPPSADVEALATQLRSQGEFDDWQGREKELSEGKLWLAPDKFKARVESGRYGDVEAVDVEPLRRALMKHAGEVGADYEAQDAAAAAKSLEANKAKSVPADKAKNGAIVIINDNGKERAVKVTSVTGGKIFGDALDGDREWFADGIDPSEVVNPKPKGDASKGMSIDEAIAKPNPAPAGGGGVAKPGDSVQFDLEGRKVNGLVDGKGNVVFKPTASERESMGLGSQASMSLSSIENDGKLRQVNGKPYSPGGGGDAQANAPGGGTSAKREASGATVKDGEVVGADAGFPGSEVKLLDGGDATPGSKVKSAKDGSSMTIIGVDPKNPNYVKVKLADGKTATRSKRTLKAESGGGGGDGGGGATPTPDVTPAAPTANAPETPAASKPNPASRPSKTNGFVPQYVIPNSARWDKTKAPVIPISDLPTGSEVWSNGKVFRVGKPVVNDDGSVVGKYWDGTQWDYVQPDTQFSVASIPSGKAVPPAMRQELMKVTMKELPPKA